MNEMPKMYSPEPQDSSAEQFQVKEGVDFVFEQHPELAEIGTLEQYSKYLETIFPKTILADIVYHGTNAKDFDLLMKEGFKKNRGRAADFEGIDHHYGFYFSDKYGHYRSGSKVRTVAAVVDIKKPKIVNTMLTDLPEHLGLSSYDLMYSLEEFYDLNNKEDAVLQVNFGHFHRNDTISKEEFKKANEQLDKKIEVGFSSDELDRLQVLITEVDKLSKDYLEKNNIDTNDQYLSISKFIKGHKRELEKSVTHEQKSKIEENINVLNNILSQREKVVQTALDIFKDDKGRLIDIPIDEMAILEPEQIHLLGSQKDQEGFKNFVQQ